MVLEGLTTDYLINLDTALGVFCPWALANGFRSVTAQVLNRFLAQVAAFAPSDFLAKNTRAGLDLLADLRQIPRPVNRLTWRLVHTISNNYKAGFKVIPSVGHVMQFVNVAPASIEHALLALVFLTGLRVFEMAYISSASITPDYIWTVNAKGQRTGRSVHRTMAMDKHIAYLKATKHGVWFKNTPEEVNAITFLMRSAMAVDPAKLPPFTLRACRRFFATFLFNNGVCSTYLMRQMNHLWWKTTQLYIILPDGVQAKWRSASACADAVAPWVAPSIPEFSFDDPRCATDWMKKWRAGLLMQIKADDLSDDDDACA